MNQVRHEGETDQELETWFFHKHSRLRNQARVSGRPAAVDLSKRLPTRIASLEASPGGASER